MVNSYWFEVYFRVSKHLGCKVSEVIKNKFNPDFRVLIQKYHMQIQAELREAERMRDEAKKYKH